MGHQNLFRLVRRASAASWEGETARGRSIDEVNFPPAAAPSRLGAWSPWVAGDREGRRNLCLNKPKQGCVLSIAVVKRPSW